jgi:transcriptional regulator with XRE-family HTH domain
MMIGERLRAIRVAKNLSQGDVEKRSGLLRCYISRVENGHSVPAVETLEKMARALDMPLYQVLYESEPSPALPIRAKPSGTKDEWGSFGKNARYLHRLRKLMARITERDRNYLLGLLQEMSKRRKTR